MDTSPCPPNGLIVPAYSYPLPDQLNSPGGLWKRLADAAERLAENLVVVVNVRNGPGEGPDSADPGALNDHLAYVGAVEFVQASGARVIGYVSTSWGRQGTSPEATVSQDINRWFQWFPVDGIFLDEVSTDPNHAVYYRKLYERIQAHQNGSALVVLNCGTVPDETYANIGSSIICMYEQAPSAEPLESWKPPSWADHSVRERTLVLAHSTNRRDWETAFKGLGDQDVGWVYITDGVLPNPWDKLPPYFEELVERVRQETVAVNLD